MTKRNTDIVSHGLPDRPLSIPEIESREWARRSKAATFADVDALLGAKAIAAAGIMETFQTEAQHPERYIQTDIGSSFPYNMLESLAGLPLDWKAVAPAAATYVAVNVLARARDYQNYGSELAKARLATVGVEDFIPHTEKSLKRFQRRQRAKRVAASILSMGAAYKLGTEVNTISNLAAGTGILGAGLVTHVVQNRRADKLPKVKATRVRRSINRKQIESEYDAHLNTSTLYDS